MVRTGSAGSIRNSQIQQAASNPSAPVASKIHMSKRAYRNAARKCPDPSEPALAATREVVGLGMNNNVYECSAACRS
ncbi:hypothetical protein VTH06DRAFT_124 [Thermothelomyces fergusii]